MWYSATKVGIMEIDMDHGNVDTMLELYTKDQAPQNYLENIVDGLIRHYGHEEEVIVRLGYEFPQNHREEHARLAKHLRSRIEDWKKGGIDGKDLAEEIRVILLLHVTEFDVRLADFERLKKL